MSEVTAPVVKVDTVDDAIRVLTIDRPEVMNALSIGANTLKLDGASSQLTDNAGISLSTGTITGQPANLGQWLSRADDEEDVYYIISDWVNEERFREYEQSEEHVVHRGNLHPYRSKGSMQTMRVVHNLTGAAARA